MYKQPDWNRLERDRQRAAQALYDSQVVGPDDRCQECDKRLSDEERGQRLCELCSAGISQDDGNKTGWENDQDTEAVESMLDDIEGIER